MISHVQDQLFRLMIAKQYFLKPCESIKKVIDSNRPNQISLLMTNNIYRIIIFFVELSKFFKNDIIVGTDILPSVS
jgi:hypothetical protein